MGIFDFLRKSTPPPGGPTLDKKVAGPAKVVADKRAQTYDRLEAIQTLCAMKSADAAAALLKRFNFSIDPSITDQEEKELAFQGIIAAGVKGELPKDEKEREKALAELEQRRDQVIDAVRTFCEKAEVLTWPLKVLKHLLDDEEYRAELLTLLEGFDTEYARNVEPKISVLMALEEVVDDEARVAIERFLEDVNETVRFHAVQTTFASGKKESIPALARLIAGEESVRVKNKIAEGLLVRGWTVPPELRDSVRDALYESDAYALGSDGKIVKTRG